MLASPGVRAFGLSLGLTNALLTHGRDYGLHPASLFTEHFAVALVINLATGVLAGLLFARLMRAFGTPIDHVGRPDREPPV